MLLSHAKEGVIYSFTFNACWIPVTRVNNCFRGKGQQPGLNGTNECIEIASRQISTANTTLEKGISGDHKPSLGGVEAKAAR